MRGIFYWCSVFIIVFIHCPNVTFIILFILFHSEIAFLFYQVLSFSIDAVSILSIIDYILMWIYTNVNSCPIHENSMWTVHIDWCDSVTLVTESLLVYSCGSVITEPQDYYFLDIFAYFVGVIPLAICSNVQWDDIMFLCNHCQCIRWPKEILMF